MGVYWIKSNAGETCEETCKRGASGLPTGMKPVEIGQWQGNGNPFKVCAGGEGPRSGYQLDGFNTTGCRIPQGDKEVDAPNHYCLCTDDGDAEVIG